jgi:hypothetical protein
VVFFLKLRQLLPLEAGVEKYAGYVPTIRGVGHGQDDAVVLPGTWDERIRCEKIQRFGELPLHVALELFPSDRKRNE